MDNNLVPGTVLNSSLLVWRSPSLLLDRRTTARSVVDFEADELGNEDIREQAVKSGWYDQLEFYPADNIVWVTLAREQAERYGKPERFKIPRGSIVIANIGDDGILFLLGRNT